MEKKAFVCTGYFVATLSVEEFVCFAVLNSDILLTLCQDWGTAITRSQLPYPIFSITTFEEELFIYSLYLSNPITPKSATLLSKDKQISDCL